MLKTSYEKSLTKQKSHLFPNTQKMASILHLSLVKKKKRMGKKKRLIYMTKILQKRQGSGETPEDLRHLPRRVKAAISSGFQNT